MASLLREEEHLAGQYPISVVIPAYGRPDLLRRCLAALLRDGLKNAEVVVVDDASPQDLRSQVQTGLAKETAASTPAADWQDGAHARQAGPEATVRWLRMERNGGPAAARNRGLEAARHDWVFFLDADVELSPGALVRIRESLHVYEHRPEVAGVLGVYDEELPWDDFWSNYKNLSVCFLYAVTETVSPYLHTPLFTVRRQVLEREGGFDSRFATAEDFRLGVLLGSQGRRFVIDRNLKGVHLKRYDFKGILREDRRRLEDLRQLDLPPQSRAFALRAHRFSRLLSASLPAPLLLTLLASPLWPPLLWATAAMVVLFAAANLRFFNYMRRQRGWGFAVRSLGFLFVEMLWAQWCILPGLAAKVLSKLGRAASGKPLSKSVR
ncbi:MAG TPA: glycosyltransferase family 2 protein [Acidobacteriota bacterium]|nr:glycosyltransferase family 2 protein [Acidobacteriota bacterium]